MAEATEELTVLELAGRCEKAARPDRELDATILACLDGYTAIEERSGWIVAVGNGVMERSLGLIDPGQHSRNFTPQHHDTPAYTASIDAAMALVPKGWRWTMREASPDKLNPNERGFFARLETADFESVTWGKGSNWITDIVAGQDAFCWAATPALALCAAALRARAAQGIEARRAVDAEGGAVGDESPVGNADAPR